MFFTSFFLSSESSSTICVIPAKCIKIRTPFYFCYFNRVKYVGLMVSPTKTSAKLLNPDRELITVVRAYRNPYGTLKETLIGARVWCVRPLMNLLATCLSHRALVVEDVVPYYGWFTARRMLSDTNITSVRIRSL